MEWNGCVKETRMNNVRIAGWAAACIGLLCGQLALAQATPVPKLPELSPDLQQRFKQADIEHKGGLNAGQAATAGFAIGSFDTIDTDHDHIITLYEISTYLASRAQDWAKADTNGDGVVTREEAEKVPSLAKIFNQADRDGDGVVRKEEHEAFSETTLYQNVDLPYVVPNIINKKF
jgi:EF hand domain-containing protein